MSQDSLRPESDLPSRNFSEAARRPLGKEEIREALDRFIWPGLPLVAKVCFGLYSTISLSHAVFLPPTQRLPLIAISMLSALYYLLAFLWIRRRPVALHHTHAVAFCFWLPVWCNSFAHLWISGDIHQSTNLLVATVAYGLFILQRRWFVLAALWVLASWVLFTLLQGVHPLTAHYAFAFLFFTALTWTFHMVQHSTVQENWRLRTLGEEQLQELKETLHELQHQQRDKDIAIMALKTYTTRMHQVLEHTPLLVCSIDVEGVILLFEGSAAEQLSLEAEEATDPARPTLDEQLPQLKPLFGQALREQRAMGVLKVGERIWDARLQLVLDPSGDAQLVVAVLLDVTDRYASQRAQEQFVSMVSHELRTPLTSINGALQLLTQDVPITLEQRQKMFDIMQRNTTRLRGIIDDLLDLSKMNAGQLPFLMKDCSLSSLVKQAIHTIETYAHQKALKLHWQAPEDGLRVFVDEQRFHQVLDNLLTNAIKFSPKGGGITLGVERVGGHVEIFIQDEGPGISEEFRERIFEPFVQADASSQRNTGGTGLGLHIARRFMRRMDGDLRLAPQATKGARFCLHLPLLPD